MVNLFDGPGSKEFKEETIIGHENDWRPKIFVSTSRSQPFLITSNASRDDLDAAVVRYTDYLTQVLKREFPDFQIKNARI